MQFLLKDVLVRFINLQQATTIVTGKNQNKKFRLFFFCKSNKNKQYNFFRTFLSVYLSFVQFFAYNPSILNFLGAGLLTLNKSKLNSYFFSRNILLGGIADWEDETFSNFYSLGNCFEYLHMHGTEKNVYLPVVIVISYITKTLCVSVECNRTIFS